MRCRCPASTSGASSAKLITAPRAILVAYCHGAARTSPSGPASHVVDSANATTAIAAIHTRRSASRCTHVPPTIASSASSMPAANHGTYPGSQLSWWMPSGAGTGRNAHVRLTSASPSSTGTRNRAADPRSFTSASARSGSTR